MGDFTPIAGTEPEKFDYIYSIYPNLHPVINYSEFKITNYPDIKVYEFIKEGEKFDYACHELERYKDSSNDKDMGSTFTHYNEIESVYGLIEVCEIINLPGHPMTIPNRNAISSKTVYRMIDGTLKVTYFTGVLYYNLEDCKKVAIKGMKKSLEFADETYKKIGKQIENEKKLWEKSFLEYPHLVI